MVSLTELKAMDESQDSQTGMNDDDVNGGGQQQQQQSRQIIQNPTPVFIQHCVYLGEYTLTLCILKVDMW